jgi:hypothetical protein
MTHVIQQAGFNLPWWSKVCWDIAWISRAHAYVFPAALLLLGVFERRRGPIPGLASEIAKLIAAVGFAAMMIALSVLVLVVLGAGLG